MNKLTLTPRRDSLSRFIDSPFSIFIDEFFNDSLPIQLVNRQESYPKYNIIRENKEITDKFTIELSLAGFTKEDLNVYTDKGLLYVASGPLVKNKEVDYLYKGIAERSFKWSLKLPQYSTITKTSFINGILSIDVSIEIPEEKKPKYYTID